MEQSRSAPTLPPVAGASPPVMRRQPRRHPQAADDRSGFLNGLLNEDLSHLSKWHGSRPHHEQKRFLRSVDTLYKAFQGPDNSPNKTRKEDPAQVAAREAATREANAAVLERIAEEDPLNGPPRTPRQQPLRPCASEPAFAPTPIDIFEEKKRRGYQRGDEDNSFDKWIDGQSVSSQTTGSAATSYRTSFSQLTKTSSGGSICSEPGTTHQAQFRAHRRGHAVNKLNWQASDQHQAGGLKDGVPHIGYPDSDRMNTAFKDFFGSRPVAENIPKAMYENVFKADSHQFVHQFVDNAQPEQREQFASMVRSLQYLRTAGPRENISMQNQAYDLAENSRMWKPPKQQPTTGPAKRNFSMVPLGSIGQEKGKTKTTKPASPPPRDDLPPPSPCVSGLGSMPLSRMSTPLVISDYDC